MSTDIMQENIILQTAVSSAAATLFAIEGADLFRALPANSDDADLHNHGCFLLGMLQQHLRQIQQQVDALAVVPFVKRGEG